MDPIALIVTALAAGAADGLTDTAAQAVNDAYVVLKSLIARKYAQAMPAIDQLEATPASRTRRAAAEEDLSQTDAARDSEVLREAQVLLKAVQRHAPEAARTIGVDLEDIKADSISLTNILTQSTGPATGVQVKSAMVTGGFVISGVKVTDDVDPTRPTSQSVPGPNQSKILFLAANPDDATRLQLDAEVRAIDQSLRLAQYRDAFDLQQAHAVRVSDLQGLLMRYRPHIVHFSGHGSPAGEIIFEDDAGRSFPVSASALTSIFSLLEDNIRCVVLNACFSIIQASAIAQHIDCVIGMSAAIGDQAAINFAAAFYQALAYGRSVKTAFGLGRNQIDLSGLGEQDTPQLLAVKADPAQVVFTTSRFSMRSY